MSERCMMTSLELCFVDARIESREMEGVKVTKSAKCRTLMRARLPTRETWHGAQTSYHRSQQRSANSADPEVQRRDFQRTKTALL